MTTLVFEPYITGHHTEHLNLMYKRAGEKTDQEFVFLVDPLLKKAGCEFLWPDFNNIKIQYLDTDELSRIECGLIKSAFRQTLLVRKYARKFRADKIFVISLMSLIPFLALLPSRYGISGIIYIIYLRNYKTSSAFRKVFDISRYFILAKANVFERILLMNDTVSPRVLNRKFGCEKFRYVPDPVSKIVSNTSLDIRKMHTIPSERKVFLHFGMLTQRKGTLDILMAIESIEQRILGNSCFIFAGTVDKEISESFKNSIKKLSLKVQILVFEGYCKYEILESLCSASDYLLVPYRMCSQSSGLLGYAARFNMPVIGNSKGLLKSLIRKYKLGRTCSTENIKEFSSLLESLIVMPKFRIDGNLYLEHNSTRRFQNIIFD